MSQVRDQNICRYCLNNYYNQMEVNHVTIFQLQNFMKNKTEATVVWNSTALVCHSSGCDVTLKMIRQQPKMFNVCVMRDFNDSTEVYLIISCNLFVHCTGCVACVSNNNIRDDSHSSCAVLSNRVCQLPDIWHRSPEWRTVSCRKVSNLSHAHSLFAGTKTFCVIF